MGIKIEFEEAYEKFRRNEQFVSALIDHLPLLVYVKDTEGRYLITNIQFQKAVNLPPEKLFGKLDRECLPPELFALGQESDRKVLETKAALRFEVRYHLNGGDHVANAVKFPLLDQSGNPYAICAIGLDVTKQKEDEAIIREQKEKMEMTVRLSALGEMAAGLAHEINTPLATINLLSAQLQDLLNEQNLERSELSKIADTLERTVQRISKIIKSLKAITRDASHDPLDSVLVQQLIDDSLPFCQDRIIYNGIRLTVETVPKDLTIDCRAAEISQVLVNLVHNASDAVAEFSENQKWIKIEVRDLKDQIEIWVTDGGKGIPEAVQKGLFRPFFTTKGIGKGTGLGLSLSLGIVRNHRGELGVDTSTPNTRFYVRLPKKKKN